MFFSTAKIPSTYHLIDSLKKLQWMKEELYTSSIIGSDIETNYPTAEIKVEKDYPEVICGVSFAWGRDAVQVPWKPGNAAYLPLTKSDDSPYWGDRQEFVTSVLKEILESDIPKVFHNGKFDLTKLFLHLEIRVRNFIFDTMLAHGLLDEERATSSHALKSKFGEDGKIVKLGVSDVYLDSKASLWKDELDSSLAYYDPRFKRYSKVPIDILYPYAAADTDLCLSLFFVFRPMLEAEGMTWVFDNVVMPFCHTLLALESYGMPVDLERARQVVVEQTELMSAAEKEVWSVLGRQFNVGSNDELGALLFEELKLPGEKTKHGKWVVDVENLTGLNHPVVEPVLKYRRAQKICSTYAQPALDFSREITDGGKIGWVHVDFSQDSLTGRLRCERPNLTNLPRPENGGVIVKGLYLCPNDYRFIFKDEGQIEIRVAAHLSGERVWIDAIRDGVDLHNLMAQKVYNLPCDVSQVKKLYKKERNSIKSISFGLVYGLSTFSLAQKLNITYEEAQKLVNEDYFGVAPTLKDWIDSVQEFVKENGYVTNMFGRRRHMPGAMVEVPQPVRWPDDMVRPRCYREGPYPEFLGIDQADMYTIDEFKIKQLIKARGHANQFSHCLSCPYIVSCMINREVKHVKSKVARILRQAVNMPVQSSAADLSFIALTAIENEFRNERMDAHVVHHVHDELISIVHVSQIEKANKIMDYYMTDYLQELTNFSVPFEVDTEIVSRWSDKYEKG